jgi:hypothetical protein
MEIPALAPEIQLERKLLLTPCSSKRGLKRWLKHYLNLDFPDLIVDERSNSTPLDVLWEIYDAAVNNKTLITGDNDEARRILMYASRGGYKTLAATVLELFAILHFKRSVVHLAAILGQSEKAQQYLRDFLSLDGLRDFNIGNNKRTVVVMWFEHKETGDILKKQEWEELPTPQQSFYRRNVYYVKIIVSTASSANSEHVSFMCIDELDVIENIRAYNEARMIPATQTDNEGRKQPPITVLLSTRKTSGGLVQHEIDESKKTGTVVRHWNALDVSEACPPSRYLPDQPKENAYIHEDTLRAWDKEGFDKLQISEPKIAEKTLVKEVHAGCIKCKILAACQGRLVNQKSKAKLLKDVSETIASFRENSPDSCIAQLLCLRPGNEGAIFARLSRENHLLSADQIWKEIAGDVRAPIGCDKNLIISFLQANGATPVCGMDWGSTHCFAVAMGWIYGRKIFILDALEIPELELSQCVEICDKKIKRYDPIIFPDTAMPAYIKTFRREGYRMKDGIKKDVLASIEAVRMKLSPIGVSAQPEMFILNGDDGCELLFKRLSEYKWMLDSAGNPTDVPKKVDDDLVDAVRYMIVGSFGRNGQIIVSGSSSASTPKTSPQVNQIQQTQQPQFLDNQLNAPNMPFQTVQEITVSSETADNFLSSKIDELIPDRKKVVKKGSFVASF